MNQFNCAAVSGTGSVVSGLAFDVETFLRFSGGLCSYVH